jgi:DNA-directed RNA polymerase specialized sigma24 family protein
LAATSTLAISLSSRRSRTSDALFQAYRKLDSFDSQPLTPWLFRIAHNRCIDFLRQRAVRESAEMEADTAESIEPAEPAGPLGRAVEHLVLTLPPKGRACVPLKDVFACQLGDWQSSDHSKSVSMIDTARERK